MHRLLRAAVLAGVLLLAVAATSASAASFVPHRVLVKYRTGVSPATRSLLERAVGGTLVDSIPQIGVRALRVAGDPREVAARLERSPSVAFAEPDIIVRATAIPNDPRFGELYGLNNTGQGGGKPDADIDAPEGWDAAGLAGFPSTGGVKVGIVDTGIVSNHEDLIGKTVSCARANDGLLGGTSIQVGSCADDNGHGTHVAGTITANANNGRGVTGAAFNSPLVICKALGGLLGTGSASQVAKCITWVHDQGAKVISMSLGGGDSSTERSAVQYAWQNGSTAGSVLVAAAGNDSNSTVEYPAGYAEVVSVAATDNKDGHASFSNTNPDVEVAGPGVNVLSTYGSSTTSYTTLSGTSMATPHASAVTAIIWDRYPTAAASTIRSKLDAAVDDLGTAGRDSVFGFGRVNLFKAATS